MSNMDEVPDTWDTKDTAKVKSTELDVLDSQSNSIQSESRAQHDGLNVEVEPSDQNEAGIGENRELVEESSLDIELGSEVIRENMAQSEDAAEKNTASDPIDKNEKCRESSQPRESIWSRLNKMKNILSSLMETKVRAFKAEIKESLQDIIKKQVN